MKNENLKKAYELEEAEASVAYITNIIMNPTKYHPRKISAEEIKINSKFDAFDPILGPAKKRTGLHNKFDMDNQEQEGNGDNPNFRKKANSINYQFAPQFRTPLNKDYDVLHTPTSYTLKDISRIHLNMNLLKKFEFPHEFQGHFIDAIMNKAPKKSLDHYRERQEPKVGRERSATLNYNYNCKKGVLTT
jgi:hypothetical protein